PAATHSPHSKSRSMKVSPQHPAALRVDAMGPACARQMSFSKLWGSDTGTAARVTAGLSGPALRAVPPPRYPGKECALRRRFRLLAGGAGDCGGEIIRRLRAGEQNGGVENESRHAVDTGVFRRIGFAGHARNILLAREPAAHEVAVHAAIFCRLHQNFAIGQIGALGEVEIHEPLFDAR